MKHTHLLILLTGALLASCGTAPLSAPEAQAGPTGLQAQASEASMKSAAATGRIGAWARGRIGAWARGLDASTVPGGALNTFSENAAAWKLIHLPEAQALAPNLGRNVIVAVVDTGLDLSHPVLSGHLTPPGTWYDFLGKDTDPSDVPTASNALYGHGTAVADLILQVAPEARILPVRALNADGEGTVADLAAGIDWAVRQGAQVINVSAVSSVDNDLTQAIARAADRGVYVTLAAGNEGDKKVSFPARNTTKASRLGQYAINAGAVNSDATLASWSNYGNALELTAPGVDLATALPGGNYALVSGTSFATPVLSGALALALGEPYKRSYAGQLALQLDATATNIDAANGALTRDQGDSSVLGNGLENAQAFLQKVR
jgi:hypothetical protein